MLSEGPKDNASAMAWRNDVQKKNPNFMYWDLIMRYETLILIFVKAQREKFPSVCGGCVGTHTALLCLGSC